MGSGDNTPSREALQAFADAVIAKFDVCPACSYLWHECECGIGANELPAEPASSGVWDTWGGDGVGP